jgi:hypothetical protein
VVAPAADEPPHHVDVEVEHPGMRVDIHLSQRRLTDARGSVHQNQTRHLQNPRTRYSYESGPYAMLHIRLVFD